MQAPLRVTPATLDVLQVLLLAVGELHGFAIAQAARRPTGSVYPILVRLEQAGWLDSYWETQHPEAGKPRRRFYSLNPTGLAAGQRLVLERRGKLPSAGPVPWRARPLHDFIARWVALR
jgi:PadR family transcriptional regulator, regulatory protein PadR